jgi:hypothetical protein
MAISVETNTTQISSGIIHGTEYTTVIKDTIGTMQRPEGIIRNIQAQSSTLIKWWYQINTQGWGTNPDTVQAVTFSSPDPVMVVTFSGIFREMYAKLLDMGLDAETLKTTLVPGFMYIPETALESTLEDLRA